MSTSRLLAPKAVALIMAGGEGKRLWPLSTPDDPKQLNETLDNDTLLIRAYHRAQTMFEDQDIFIVTTQRLVDKVKVLLTLPETNWIIQPENGDTAMAISLAALYLEAHFPERVAVMFYSDQVIEKLSHFKKAVNSAIKLAATENKIIVIGTQPTEPSTELGYIEIGEQMSNKGGVFGVSHFKEKPNLETAQTYLDKGNFVWNTGVYVWKTQVLLQEIKKVAPDVYTQLLELRYEIGGGLFAVKLEAWYNQADLPSFEKLISEKLKEMLVLVGKFEWRDVGNWDSFYQLGKKDMQGNVVVNPNASAVDLVDTENCLVIPNQMRVSLLGLRDIVVVQTKDNLLICRRDLAGKVKELAE